MSTFTFMTEPLTPASLAFRDNGAPFSPHYDDIYHSAVGGLAQAEYVFLHGNVLPDCPNAGSSAAFSRCWKPASGWASTFW